MSEAIVAEARRHLPDAEDVLRFIETATSVKRRYQFFVWSQSYLRGMLPHDVLLCGWYSRESKRLRFEAFSSMSGTDALPDLLHASESADRHVLSRDLMDSGACGSVVQFDADSSLRTWFREALVVGVCRPQRTQEIESLFAFGRTRQRWDASAVERASMLLPYLHASYRRVLETEHTCAPPSSKLRVASAPIAAVQETLITARECEVLSWVREGLSNAKIGDKLKVSPLTVKNHVQKILTKLGAANRAQAVARAMALGLLRAAD